MQHEDTLRKCVKWISFQSNCLWLPSAALCIDRHWITEGGEFSMTCALIPEEDQFPVWKFKNQTLLAQSISPISIGIDNVRGEIVNETYSYLHIQKFGAENVGNYKCLYNKTLRREYYLDLLGKPRICIY